jgi:hypothetical protein
LCGAFHLNYLNRLPKNTPDILILKLAPVDISLSQSAPTRRNMQIIKAWMPMVITGLLLSFKPTCKVARMAEADFCGLRDG